MACYHPLQAYRTGEDGHGPIVFDNRKNKTHSQLLLPCGQCIGCKLERSRTWAIRCTHEASLYDSNAYVTLTYKPEDLPEFASLRYSDYQRFMKRVRKRYAHAKIRYYVGGEYGEQFGRPHFHACLFNIDFKDKTYLAKSNGYSLYESDELTRLWTHGGTTCGEVTFKSAAYIARYCLQKITGPLARQHYEYVDSDGVIHQRTPEFNRSSQSIGRPWLKKFPMDVYPEGTVLHNNIKTRAPRNYDKWFEQENPQAYELLELGRFIEGLLNAKETTPKRRADRETVAKARIRTLKRTIT